LSIRDTFKPYQLQWLTWIIVLLVTLAISLFFGVNYPIPEQPDQPPEPVLSLPALTLTAQGTPVTYPLPVVLHLRIDPGPDPDTVLITVLSEEP